MKKIVLLILITNGFSLQGCDFQGGLVRYAYFESTLTPQCVKEALENVDGLTNVRYSQPSSKTHRFDYDVEGISNFLQYQTESFNYIRYWNGYFFLNTIPDRKDIDKIHPYLIEIDKSVEKECNINLTKHVEEECSRMKCK